MIENRSHPDHRDPRGLDRQSHVPPERYYPRLEEFKVLVVSDGLFAYGVIKEKNLKEDI